jgi:hypothetical protein
MIWIFGDSFSLKYSDKRFISNLQYYIDWKGYESKLYFELLSEEYDLEYKNMSRPGMCNRYLFHQFMKEYSQIKSDDIVIFNWTEISRFTYFENSDVRSSLSKDYNEVFSSKTFDEILVNRKNKQYIEEQYDIINFINQTLKDNRIIHWTWSTNTDIPQDNDYTIIKETRGLIEDYHFGESGHKYLFDVFHNQLKINKNILFNLWEK